MPSVDFRLLLVTDRQATQGRPLSAVIEAAVEGGVPAVQLRERDVPTADLVELVRRIHRATSARRVPLIVNDRVDLALALDIAGVHLRSSSLPVSAARRLLGPHRLLGVSTHSLDEVRRANEEGADYVVFGPVYETPSKRAFGPPLGLDALAAACRHSSIPVFAIGGITRARTHDVRRAGAHGVAVIAAILARDDVAAATRELLAAANA
ncbi:thiamine phosphate synthase [Nitrospira moscoviensis]|uniref:Thiamine-phosphate synthase n=1 Tax=Nitrospira moscoviensis TaxID=42253 RepID=A0A0K2GG85_NITMO|nr:thiamine phosphate synthase [Nitrospira moscoviensis]ALA59946.1 putative thiamine-phosphate synthase [Nitrospira moscoviensis]